MNDHDYSIQDEFNRELGQKVRKARKHAGFSQTDLSLEIGVHRNTVGRWEEGEDSVPLWMLLRIAYTLQVSHLILLPTRELIWGRQLAGFTRERDPLKDIVEERDPQLPREQLG